MEIGRGGADEVGPLPTDDPKARLFTLSTSFSFLIVLLGFKLDTVEKEYCEGRLVSGADTTSPSPSIDVDVRYAGLDSTPESS